MQSDPAMLPFDFIQGPAHDDFSLVQHGNVIGDSLDFLEQMGGENDGVLYFIWKRLLLNRKTVYEKGKMFS